MRYSTSRRSPRKEDPFTSQTGRACFRNVSDQPIVVDVGSPLEVRAVGPDGKPVEDEPFVLSRERWTRENEFIEIAAGDSLWMWKFSAGATRSAGGLTNRLPPGKYVYSAHYECARDKSAEHGAKGPAWTGSLKSNEVEVEIP